MKTFIANSINDLDSISKEILKNIYPGKPLLLNGELGAGKTTLVKYIGKHLGIKETINSPSFIIMKIYPKLVHMDAYRISGTLDEYIDYFDDDKILIIEWSNNVDIPFSKYLKIDVNVENGKHIYTIIEDKDV